MEEIKVYDKDRQQITMLVQWDLDIYIYIRDDRITTNHNVHFFNSESDVAYVVPSTYESGVLCCKIPNRLLFVALPITGYIYETEDNDSYRNTFVFTIIVRSRTIPSDFMYIPDALDDYISVVKALAWCQDYAETACACAAEAEDWTNMSKSWAVGDTGVRGGEDTDNSKYYCQQAASSASDAATSAKNAKTSETNAKTSETNAAASATSAAESAEKAAQFDPDIYALKKYYDNDSTNVGRKSGTSSGNKSFTLGYNCEASGDYAFAEGYNTIASGGTSGTGSDSGSSPDDGSTPDTGGDVNAGGTEGSAKDANCDVLFVAENSSYSVGDPVNMTLEVIFTAACDYFYFQSNFDLDILDCTLNSVKLVNYETNSREFECIHSFSNGDVLRISLQNVVRTSGTQVFQLGFVAGSGYLTYVNATVTVTNTLSIQPLASIVGCTHAEGSGTTASGSCSHSEGEDNIAYGEASHAEGYNTMADGNYSHAEGRSSVADGSYSHAEGESSTRGTASHSEGYGAYAYGNWTHAEGYKATADGSVSHAEGYDTFSAMYSHAEGYMTNAYGEVAHAEGGRTTAKGNYSHAEGYGTTASGYESHAEGNKTTASGNYSHAEGYECEASEASSHAEGNGVTASGSYSHAEGNGTTASKESSHAEGNKTTASGNYSHAEGNITTSSGSYSHAGGNSTIASGTGSFAIGYETHATAAYAAAFGNSTYAQKDYSSTFGALTYSGSPEQTVVGFRNNYNGNGEGTSGNYNVFVVGGGVDGSNMNALRVTTYGYVYAYNSFNTSGMDYAEFIKEWADGNPDDEDRVGYFVTVKDGLLYKADKGDYIVGITSGNPSVVGNADEDYYWKYDRDDFGRVILQDIEDEETGDIIEDGSRVISADYDESLQSEYIERKDRPEWDYVGMIGVIPVRDDGTCQVDAYCKCGGDGIATYAEERGFDTYRVIERVSENVVTVIMR